MDKDENAENPVSTVAEMELEEPTIDPIPEQEPHRNGDAIVYEKLIKRVETLENRFNKLIEAIDKSKRVKNI